MSFTNVTASRLLKSQLAGFFAFLLLGCSPASEPASQRQLMQQAVTKPAAAMQLAQQRLGSDELTDALQWFRQAASLGDSAGLEHALQLQQRLEGRLATAHWLQQQLAVNNKLADVISTRQRAVLGLWSTAPATMLNTGYQPAAGCSITIQPVASQQAGVERWQHLKQQWASDAQLRLLPVCFNELVTVRATELNCSEQATKRIACNTEALTELVLAGNFSQLLIIAGQGIASFNNGIVQLPDTASLALLQHEFLHILGFIDEYPLSYNAAGTVCLPGTFSANLLFDNSAATLSAYQQHWQLASDSAISLTPVTTCQALQRDAYRVVATVNPMQSYQSPLPPLYQQLMVQALQTPEHIMPVQYYFAYLARQQKAWQQWQDLMQLAASYGYVDAINALQQ